MNGTYARAHPMTLATWIILIVLGVTQHGALAQVQPRPYEGTSVPAGAAEDPPGGDAASIANQPAADQMGACETFGGTATAIEQRMTGTVDVRCTGGILDGLACPNSPDEPACTFARGPASAGEDSNVTAAGGIELIQREIVEGFADLAGSGVTPDMAEDPAGTDTTVIAQQSGDPVTDNATAQVIVCEGFGGQATVDLERTVGGLQYVLVSCNGGLLDGLRCDNGSGGTRCWWHTVRQDEGIRVTPGDGIEIVPESPTETAAAETPPTLTVMPTKTPTVVPTAISTVAPTAPTEAPVLPTVPTNDNAVPPGQAEDPARDDPAPTEAPLR